MQRTSFAPVLSATRSRDSCWITVFSWCEPRIPSAVGVGVGDAGSRSALGQPKAQLLLGLLEDLDDAPALGGGQRPGLHEEDTVTDAGGVLLVVRLELAGAAQGLLVQRVLHAVLDGDDDGLVHLVADDEALTGLAEAPVVLGHTAAFCHAAPPVRTMPS